ncbi:MAG: hypothetical protein GYB42_04950 [Alphaproteobacteria bacterium]|nr:hypothetical protein [Alphaproteobacteria bacterium]
MEISFNPRHYAHVPVYYWPWVCWQLFWLRAWVRASGREVLFEISQTGRVCVVLIGDDPSDLRAWLGRRRGQPCAHHVAMDNASGEAHLCAIHYWMGRLMQRGALEIWVWVRVLARPLPAIIDTS